jgi:DUF1365 family protein
MFYLDPQELAALPRALRFFKIGTGFFYKFVGSDYLPGPQKNLLDRVKDVVQSAGITAEVKQIRLLTTVRIFNYVFNPVSLIYCFDDAENPVCAVAEVTNTFGERKPYVVPFSPSGIFLSSQPKLFYVSPFSPLEQDLKFALQLPADQLLFSIASSDRAGVSVAATMSGKKCSLTDANLLRLTLKYPLVTLRTITLIHLHALILWLKRIPYFRKEENPHLQTGMLPARLPTGAGPGRQQDSVTTSSEKRQ